MVKNNMISFPLARPERGIFVDPECENEIRDIINAVDHVVRFKKDYDARLDLLAVHRELAPQVNPQWFEYLKHTDSPLYSMHIASLGNMRILYISRKTIVFLCAFMEKEGAGRKRQSYTQYIPIAESRMLRYNEEA